MSAKITLDDLYSDAGSFDEEAVLRVLKDRIIFTKENEILFVTDPDKLTAKDATLLYALAKKVLASHQKIDDELITATEIATKIKKKDSAVGMAVKRLKDKNMLMPSGTGYAIPIFKVAEILKSLQEEVN